jgi:septal ring factor EnvC (AmiA/AmiB activator)
MIPGKKIFFLRFLCVILVLSGGCVSVRAPEETTAGDLLAHERQGVYHKVRAGETLWRIAKTYNVSIKEITSANNILQAAKIEKNQLVFIPGATAVLEVPSDVDTAQNEFVWPLQGKIIGYFHQERNGRLGKGIDIQAQEGEMVKAARTGRVVFADYLSGWGYTVILDHLDGLHSVYARNAKLLVKLDQTVLKNQNIARVGRMNERAYLHFQIRKKSVEDNPLYYLP